MACAKDHDLAIISTDYAAMCQPESIDYMWIVIAVEAVLLVAVLAKLGYDVWHYYKTGEMPWLANYICLGLGYSGEGSDGNDVECIRGVMIPTLYPDRESDFQVFGDSGSGFGSSKKRNHTTCYVMIPDPESDFQPFGSIQIRIWIQ